MRFRIPPGEIGQRFTAKDVTQIHAYDQIIALMTEDDLAAIRLNIEAARIRRML